MHLTIAEHRYGRTPLVVFAVALALPLFLSGCTSTRPDTRHHAALKNALTLHASFDQGPNADFAAGDARLHSAPNMDQPRTGTPGLPANQYATIAQDQGKFGHALQFHRSVPDMVFFHADKNIAYRDHNWSGTVSLWLRVTPDEDLAPGYTDPIQITSKAWNDAAFFVEFTKDEVPREFRLGAYADYPVWNPRDRKWEEIPLPEKPLVRVIRPPFRRDKWTHVVFTFENFNTGRGDGVTRLYLDGVQVGALSPREQSFTWEAGKARIMLGLSFIGFLDELSIFNRALTAAEIEHLHRLPSGIASLRDVDAKK